MSTERVVRRNIRTPRHCEQHRKAANTVVEGRSLQCVGYPAINPIPSEPSGPMTAPDPGARQDTTDRMMRRHTIATIAVSVPAFSIGGAMSRYNLRMTETRWQIAAFVMLAVSTEVLLHKTGPNRASLARGTLNAVAAALVIVSVKFHLEPAARKHDSAIARDVAKTVKKAVIDRE